VIAILGVLLALLLPAVQKVRAAAARSQSMNNLHQIALAAHQYEAQNTTLPDAVTPIDNTPLNLAFSSPFTKLLPFVEQQALYRDLTARGRAASLVTVKPFVSPLDGSTAATEAGTSYVANDQVFGQPGKSLAKSFRDGTGQTILFTERLMLCGPDPFP